MFTRRRATLALLATAPAFGQALSAPSPATERLRAALGAYLAAWARRDAGALLQLHTADTLYVDPYLNEKKGRDQLAGYLASMTRLYDLHLHIERLVLREEDSQAVMVLREHYGELPRRNGRYVRDFDRTGIFSRWRLEEDAWRIAQFIDSTTRSASYLAAEGL